MLLSSLKIALVYSGLDSLDVLHSFLLDGELVPAEDVLYTHRLAAHGYTRSQDNATLRQAFISATVNHLAIKAELLPLFRAWKQAGISFIIFKGFYLAEFVYPSPAQRVYDDVDILLKPAQTKEARRIARALGWLETWSREEAPNRLTHAHEEVHLDKPGTVRLDVHRYIIHSHSFWDTLQKRITQAAWDKALEQVWEGTTIKVLHPVDTILLGLVLNRTWSDSWQLKPHDIIDFRYAIQRFDIARRDLEERAEELGCARSLALFLKRCNPWEAKLELSSPSPLQRQYWNMLIVPERGHLGLESVFRKLHGLPALIEDIVKQLPGVLRVARAWQREENLETFMASLPTPPQVKQLSFSQKDHVARGIKWSANFTKPLQREHSLLMALALFTKFRSLGQPVTFYQGTLQAGSGPQRRAWVEMPGRQPESIAGMRPKGRYVDETAYRYP